MPNWARGVAMGALDNITFEGQTAGQLQSAYQFLYDNSNTFQESLDECVASIGAQPIVGSGLRAQGSGLIANR